MDITLKANLRTKKPDKNGECPVAISIRGGGREIFYHVGFKVHPDFWDGSSVLKGVANHDVLNNTLQGLITGTEREILVRQAQKVDVTLEMVKAILRPDTDFSGGNFIAFYKDFVDYLATNKSVGYVKHFRVEYNSFVNFVGKRLHFSVITTELLQKYESSLLVAFTTKNTKMKRLKEVIQRAVDRELIAPKQIAGYKWPGYRKPMRGYLTLAETDRIGDAIYNGNFDNDRPLLVAACYFLVECYSGIRISDWPTFRIETLIKGDNFKCTAKKNGEPIYLPLAHFPRLARIVRHIHDNEILFDITPQAVNRLLRFVAKEAKIEKELTSHVGRHTFGTLLGELRWTTAEIAEAMGISEDTAKTYVKNLREKVRTAAERCGGL